MAALCLLKTSQAKPYLDWLFVLEELSFKMCFFSGKLKTRIHNIIFLQQLLILCVTFMFSFQ